MAQVNKLAPFILKWEGGFVNDPSDRGGATNQGVTIATYTAYKARKGQKAPSIQDLQKLQQDEWQDILKTMYWDKWQADHIHSQKLANILVDWVWGSGKWGIVIPQRLLGVQADGIVGVKTLEALNALEPNRFFNIIFEARKKFLHEIVNTRPANRKFLKGWLNRLEDLKRLTP